MIESRRKNATTTNTISDAKYYSEFGITDIFKSLVNSDIDVTITMSVATHNQTKKNRKKKQIPTYEIMLSESVCEIATFAGLAARIIFICGRQSCVLMASLNHTHTPIATTTILFCSLRYIVPNEHLMCMSDDLSV